VKTMACPNCAQAISLPQGLEQSTTVECPICGDEFAVEDVVDEYPQAEEGLGGPAPEVTLVAGASPPAAEPPSQTEQTAENLADEEKKEDEEEDTSAGLPQQDRPAEAALRVRCPCCGEAFPLDRAIVVHSGRELGPEAVTALTDDGTPRQSPADAGGVGFDFGDQVSETVLPRIDAGDQTDQIGAGVAAFDFQPPPGVEGAQGTPVGSLAARRRGRDSEKSVFRELVGIVLGGAAGLFIAYYGLNFFGGKRFDFLEIYLPGVKHTREHRPDWLPFGGKTRGETGDEEPFDSGLDTPLGQPVEPGPEETDPTQELAP